MAGFITLERNQMPPLDHYAFQEILKANIRPAKPIDTPALLQGRSDLLRAIARSLNSPGMHVFVHGQRGVGKTSLALTAARPYHEDDIPLVGCEAGLSLYDLVIDLCRLILRNSLLARTGGELSATAGFNFGIFKAEAGAKGLPRIDLPSSLHSMNEAALLIKECIIASGRTNTVVIIDELDRVRDDTFNRNFADLIKRIHDQNVPVTFIMCGIGRNLDEIIGNHLSASRSIAPFELPPISHDARWQIISNAADKLGYCIGKEFYIRLGQISDGYPYYIHLVAENLFWNIFDHQSTSCDATSDDFHRAIATSIERAEAPLKNAYNFAIQKTKGSTDYEEALWAMAESTHFERQIKDIYEKSYLKIISERTGRNALSLEMFRTRLYSLCDERHGKIIVRKRNSWYGFDENVMRGYVRLVAERHNICLGQDHF